MATALVVRAQRYKKIGDKTSPLVYILKRKPRDAKMYDLKRISEEIEALGGMSAEDVLHVGKAIVRPTATVSVWMISVSSALRFTA